MSIELTITRASGTCSRINGSSVAAGSQNPTSARSNVLERSTRSAQPNPA